MNRKAKVSVGVLVVIGVLLGAYHVVTRISVGSDLRSGTRIDELNGVAIIYNGGANESHGRNQTADGYNLGIRYQCVEFVKRYYFERFGHRMPDSYGHAKTFFDRSLADGALNETRGLLQFRNGSSTGPASDDIVIFGPSLLNPYGHVAVIAQVNSYAIVIAQQNAGPVHSSRESIPLAQQDGGYHVKNDRVLGWLRLPDSSSRSLHPDALTGGG